jgi:nucleoside-diphosphate-sugar epimerase
MKRVAVLGAAGFLGSALSSALERKGHEVLGIYRYRKPNTKQRQHTDSFMSSRVWKVDLVINAAVSYGRDSPLDAIASNLMMPLGVLEKAIGLGVSFVNLESFFQKFPIATYSTLRDYSLSKQLFSSALRHFQRELSDQKSYSLKVLGLSVEHLYGPGDAPHKFVPWILDQMESGVSRIELTHGNQLRDFIFIDDAVDMIVSAVEKLDTLRPFESLEIGTGQKTSIRDFVETAAHATGFKGELVWGALNPPEGEITSSFADQKLSDLLGHHSFVEPREGIFRILESTTILKSRGVPPKST